MHGDFSRVTFRPEKRYSAVVAQQGRVQLDAEANEHAAIQAYLGRRLAADLIGPHAGPAGEAGFELDFRPGDGEPADLGIGPGRYYVDGILVDATKPARPRPVGEPSTVPSTAPSTVPAQAPSGASAGAPAGGAGTDDR